VLSDSPAWAAAASHYRATMTTWTDLGALPRRFMAANCGGGGAAGGTTAPQSRRLGRCAVIAEAQMPPVAQRLRDDDSSGRNRVLGALPGGGLGAILVRAGLLTGPRRLVVVGGRMNAFGCSAGVAGVAGWLSVGSVRRRRPCPLRFSPSCICVVGQDCGSSGATGGTTAPQSRPFPLLRHTEAHLVRSVRAVRPREPGRSRAPQRSGRRWGDRFRSAR
jgi:hypothetical protein